MSVPNGERLATKQDLADMYQGILPYLGGMPEVLANKFSKGDMYSTDEKMIGQWIDGKPIYQKTITGLSLTMTWNEQYHTRATIPQFPIDKSLISTIISASGITTSGCVPLAVHKNASIFLANDQFTINSVTWCYTKTTDSAISIGDDTDYSTEEKIIGTWIDGRPLYQKTIDFGALPNATEKSVNHNISNINEVIYIGGTSKRSSDTTKGITMNLDKITSAVQCRNDVVYVTTTDDRRDWDVTKVTLQYTKTT